MSERAKELNDKPKPDWRTTPAGLRLDKYIGDKVGEHRHFSRELEAALWLFAGKRWVLERLIDERTNRADYAFTWYAGRYNNGELIAQNTGRAEEAALAVCRCWLKGQKP